MTLAVEGHEVAGGIVRVDKRGNAGALDYQGLKPKLLSRVLESYRRLAHDVDLVLIEGAGSPAEINLRAGDIANMVFPSTALCDAATGRMAIRSGMYNIGMLLESHGMSKNEVTMAEVLSEAGYATAFFGKAHLGDVEESYLHNQGFDEALFPPMNQITSLYDPRGTAANAVLGSIVSW